VHGRPDWTGSMDMPSHGWRSYVELSRQLERLALRHAEIGGGRRHASLPQQLADDLDIMRMLIHQGGLRPSHGVGTKLPWIEPGRGCPTFDQAAVLRGAQRLGRVCPHTREKIMPGQFTGDRNPLREDMAAIGEKGHDGPLACFLLTTGALLHDLAGMIDHICHFQAEQITPTQHGVHAHREKSQVAEVARISQNLFDGLDVTGTDWGCLTNRFSFVPGRDFGHGFCPSVSKANMRAASIAWTCGETIDALTIVVNAYRIALAQSRHEEGTQRSACVWGSGALNGNFAQMVLDTQDGPGDAIER